MSNTDSNPKNSLILESMRRKSIPDAIADLAAIVESMIAAHEGDGSAGSHGRFLMGMLIKDNLEMIAERARKREVRRAKSARKARRGW